MDSSEIYWEHAIANIVCACGNASNWMQDTSDTIWCDKCGQDIVTAGELDED